MSKTSRYYGVYAGSVLVGFLVYKGTGGNMELGMAATAALWCLNIMTYRDD